MNHAGFVIGSYVLTGASIVAYVVWFLRKARNLNQHATDADKPWT